ncbi:MAG: tetratricopeptide repeat protein, partial [Alphaproteobacteria bacterium]|nr:tetratricopeptide repeat protein [Alphaproteobacteria bacterium]
MKRLIAHLIAAFATATAATAITPGEIDVKLALCTRLAGQPGIDACSEVIAANFSSKSLETAYTQRAMKFQTMGKLEEAVSDYSQSLAIDPYQLEATVNRGKILVALHRSAEAVVDLKHSLAMFPHWAAANMILSQAYRDLHDSENALAAVDRAVQLEPGNAAYVGARGILHLDRNEVQEALQDLTRSLELRPNVVQMLMARGAAYSGLGQSANALKDLDEALSMEPTNPGALNARCWVRASLKQEFDLALADCNAAIATTPHAAMYDTRAFLHLQFGHYAAAIADYDQALRIQDRYAPSLFGRGVAKIRSGDTAG